VTPGRTPVASITPEQQIVGATLLGKVINYFTHLGVATLVLEAPLAVGDTIRIKGHTTDLTQRIDSLQVAHQSVQSASAGEGVGIHVADKVRTSDAVYKV
jgi:putative protease